MPPDSICLFQYSLPPFLLHMTPSIPLPIPPDTPPPPPEPCYPPLLSILYLDPEYFLVMKVSFGHAVNPFLHILCHKIWIFYNSLSYLKDLILLCRSKQNVESRSMSDKFISKKASGKLLEGWTSYRIGQEKGCPKGDDRYKNTLGVQAYENW